MHFPVIALSAAIILSTLISGCATFQSEPSRPIVITPDMLPGGGNIPKHPGVLKPHS